MGKVKQAIQELEEEIISLVEDGFKLNEICEQIDFDFLQKVTDAKILPN